MKVSYGLMVIGVTIAVSELYEQLEEFSNHLLLLRLEETAIGAAIAATCALIIFPIPTRKVASIAIQGYLRALSDLLAQACTRVTDGNDEGSLTAASRALDYANQQFIAAAKPLRFTPFRRNRLEHNVALLSITAHQARNVAAEITRHGDDFTPLDAGELAEALATERDGAVALAESLATAGTQAPAVRLADLTLASLENALNDGDVRVNGYQRRLLLAIERLDAALNELRENLLAAPPSESSSSRSRSLTLRSRRPVRQAPERRDPPHRSRD
jgi:uncharacterized membrane protein YccC